MTRIVVRPREVRIWIRPDGGVQWQGRMVSPKDLAIMGLMLQQSAVSEMGGVQLQKSGTRKMFAPVKTVAPISLLPEGMTKEDIAHAIKWTEQREGKSYKQGCERRTPTASL